MLNILFFAAAVTLLPPMPSDYVPPKQPVLSPKQMELKASLGTPMAKTMLVPTVPQAPVQGFVLTNILVATGQVTLGWQDGQPVFQVQGQQNLLGSWQTIGQLTTAHTKTFPIDQNRFFRVVGSNYMQLSITHTNPTTLTWVAPEINMSDTLQSFRVYRAPSLPANGTPSSTTGWTEITNGTPPSPIPTNETLDANGKFHIDDPTQPNPTLFYKIIETTGNGVVVPYDVKSASANNPVWAKRFGSTGGDNGSVVTIDASGNILVAGYFQGTINLGGNDLTGTAQTLFLAKFSSLGDHIWSKSFGGTGDITPICIAFDSLGNILLGGYFTGTVSFGGANITSAAFQDAFVVKYDSLGVHQWSYGFGGPSSDQVNGIVADSQGNVIITGWFQSQAHPILIAGSSMQSLGQADTFIAKYALDGTGLWAKSFYNGGWDQGSGVAVDASDNIILAGYHLGTINFKNNTFSSSDPYYRGTPSGYLAKFDSSGGYLWDSAFGHDASVRVYAMVTDSAGDIVVCGDYNAFYGTDLGGGHITSDGTDVDIFVAKYSGTDGHYLWANPIKGGTGSTAYMNSVAVDAQKNVIVTGAYKGPYNFGNKTLAGGGIDGAYDGFLAKYSSVGTPIWAQSFGGVNDEQGKCVAADPTGHPIVIGYFNGTASFDGSSLSTGGTHDPALTLTSAGGLDIFLARFAP